VSGPCKGCGTLSVGLYCDECRTPPEEASPKRMGGAALRQLVQQKQKKPEQGPAPDWFSCILPWSMLVSDNRNVGVTGKKEDRDRFKAAKLRAQEYVREAYGDREPHPGPVTVTLTLFMPDERVRDPANFLKGGLDSLKGIAIRDDEWRCLRRLVVDTFGVDCDRPRCEVDIRAYHPEVLGAAKH
jgi:hypothetical protein